MAAKKGPVVVLALLAAGVAALAVVQLWPGAGGGRRVAVYTAHAQEDVDFLVPRFEAATGIEVDVVKLGSGEIGQRVRAEAERPQADVIWSIAGDQLEAIGEHLEPYAPPAKAALEPAWVVSDRWLPYTGIVVALVVNTDQVAAGERPRTWTDLADPAWAGRVASARADKSGSAYMQLTTVLEVHGPEAGWDVFGGIMANATLTGSSSAVPRLVNDGEAAVGLTLEDAAHRYVKGGGPVAVAYPEDGTVAAPDGIALVRGGPSPAAGKAFVDWALSKEVQALLVERIGRRAVRTDVPAPGDLPPLGELETIPYPFATAAERRAERVARWKELVAGLGG